ncbi:hypothetical protein BKH41_03720 [Helicobacter sp. 12S02232-10]|uniref:hypothetical protein n=1 Tax=Helicobacter sp. 12S02232-10 TaxID=1476197 RepID=UPI000BA65B1B|nr:hypothetical protein [Helicobacter sp. 12S02232-10]PAF49200.1 hypothetical protein BKH41_03720 [Helicobacter sp. 12S02232-10]
MKEKAFRNLRIADILDRREFDELKDFSREHLCSVIVNRLYYGVFLLAKSILIEKGYIEMEDRLTHSTNQHNGLWFKLNELFPKFRNDIIMISDLRGKRNQLDYQEDTSDCLRLLESSILQAKYLEESLKELK